MASLLFYFNPTKDEQTPAEVQKPEQIENIMWKCMYYETKGSFWTMEILDKFQNNPALSLFSLAVYLNLQEISKRKKLKGSFFEFAKSQKYDYKNNFISIVQNEPLVS